MNGEVSNNPSGSAAPHKKCKLTMLLMLVIAVLLLAASFLAGWSLAQNGEARLAASGDVPLTCSEGDVVERLTQSGILPPDVLSQEPVHSLSGNATVSGTDYVELTAQVGLLDPPTTFRATTDANTTITIQRAKNSQQMSNEIDAFQAQLEAFDGTGGDVPPEPPSPVTTEDGTVADIAADMYLTITTDANIRESTEFLATTIVAFVPAVEPEPEPLPDDFIAGDEDFLLIPEEALPAEPEVEEIIDEEPEAPAEEEPEPVE